MRSLHIFYFILLGCFWGLSPSLYKLMGEAGLPISHVIVYTGIAVGIALLAAAFLRHRRITLTREIAWYGLGCGVILNVPFALSLLFSRHIAATEYALIVSTAPFWNYAAALATGRENVALRRLVAVAVGFASSAVLILSRGGFSGPVSSWMVSAFSVPIIYSAYNWFAARYWPKEAEIMTVGAAESIFSGLLGIPFLLVFAPPWSADAPVFSAYWPALVATVMWVIERIAFFSLIRDRGAVYTIQAIYVSTPAAVLWAILIFGGGTDRWLWASLAILMLALWLNNSGRRGDSAVQ
jgi:drug/metabolite transporter (DMT)-like permease